MTLLVALFEKFPRTIVAKLLKAEAARAKSKRYPRWQWLLWMAKTSIRHSSSVLGASRTRATRCLAFSVLGYLFQPDLTGAVGDSP